MITSVRRHIALALAIAVSVLTVGRVRVERDGTSGPRRDRDERNPVAEHAPHPRGTGMR